MCRIVTAKRAGLELHTEQEGWRLKAAMSHQSLVLQCISLVGADSAGLRGVPQQVDECCHRQCVLPGIKVCKKNEKAD